MSDGNDMSFNAFVHMQTAFGGTPLATKTANAMFIEGFGSMRALADLYQTLGPQDFRIRIGKIRNLGDKSVTTAQIAVQEYLEGQHPENGVLAEGEADRWVPKSADLNYYQRLQNTLATMKGQRRTRDTSPLFTGDEDAMTFADLATTLEFIVGSDN